MSWRSRSRSLGALAVLLAVTPAQAQKSKKAGRPAEPPVLPVPPAPVGPKTLSETLTGDAKAAYEGGKLLYGDGDFAGAKVKFQAAYDVAKEPRLLWNMAVCEKGLRHYARVVALTKKYLELGGTLLAEEDRTEAKDLLNAIESFTVELSLAISEPGAEVVIDGESVGLSPLAKPVTVDIGSREISVKKPGFKPYQSSVPVGGQKQTTLNVALVAELHEGTLSVTVPQGGRILIDGKQVGSGNWTGKLKSGGHTLRVERQGMRPYQSEVVVQDDEKRGVDVVLEPVQVAAPPPEHHGPLYDMELGLRTGYGVINTRAEASDGNHQTVSKSVSYVPLWLDIGYRLGRPTYLGTYTQFGWLDKSDTCGIVRHGAEPTNIDDPATRYGYTSCWMLKGGVALVFHVMPRTIVDPYFGFDVGVQGTFAKWRNYDPLTEKTSTGNDNNASFQPGFQLGIDVHPVKDLGIGLFGHAAPHIGSEGQPHDNGQDSSSSCAPGTGPGTTQGCVSTSQNSCTDCDGGSHVGSHIMVGTRIAYTFP